MSDVFQSHVLPNAKADLSQSELFTNEDTLDNKDKDFINNISSKSSKDLTPKEQERLKHIVRKNTPVSTRIKIWLLLSGGAEITYQALYKETCEELFTQGDFIPDGEEANNKQFLTYYLTTEGGNKLRRVLCVIKHLNPDITYCPLLEPIISILLHYFDEEDTFSVVSGLLSGSFSAPFMDQTKIENVTTDATLQDLFLKVNKKGFNRLNSFFKPEESTKNKVALFPAWRMCIFENLDFVSLTRLLDCLFAEGVKMLFRVGLYILQTFYDYSLTFQQLHCSTPHDLVATIGQYAESVTFSAEDLLKNATKINITTKQVIKMKQENNKLYKAQKLEWSERTIIKQVVAVDLRQVSDIIKPNQWQELNEWLPARVQIMQPFMLFTTNKDGYNLKTLYQLCEDEEQTLVIIQTSNNEIFGAYLSASLQQRHDGRANMSYFGTGETFLFKLAPAPKAYHWDESLHQDDQKANIAPRMRKKSHYVFVDTIPLIKDIDDRDTSKKKTTDAKLKKRKTSMKRRISKKLNFTSSSSSSTSSKPGFDRSVSRSAYSNRGKEVSVSIHPLSAINIKRSTYSVPKHLFLGNKSSNYQKLNNIPENKSAPDSLKDYSDSGSNNKRGKLMSAQTIDLGEVKKLHKSSNVVIEDDEEDLDGGLQMHKTRSQTTSTTTTGGARPKLLTKTSIIEEEDEEGESNPSTGEDVKVKTVSLFISCDDIRIIVGGGNGEGLWMDGELAKGRSTKCDTFKNEPLTTNESGDFSITRVDVFGFQ
ncbi:GTPase-activating protein skywalker-like [Clytia hemisphaerica]|uniref:TBC1 domain family member 24 n=1 Tax=Clytia hemisphaerica TaxID=252671 RepID=A0A7M5X3C8_9CNID